MDTTLEDFYLSIVSSDIYGNFIELNKAVDFLKNEFGDGFLKHQNGHYHLLNQGYPEQCLMEFEILHWVSSILKAIK